MALNEVFDAILGIIFGVRVFYNMPTFVFRLFTPGSAT